MPCVLYVTSHILTCNKILYPKLDDGIQRAKHVINSHFDGMVLNILNVSNSLRIIGCILLH